jgi:NADH-quinone oxidoreductase subunit K
MMIPLAHYLIVSAALFVIGATGVLMRRNAILIFMSIELMLNAVNLTFIAFAAYLNLVDGQVFVFFVITVAAAEVAVGLAILVYLYYQRLTTEVDDINQLKG